MEESVDSGGAESYGASLSKIRHHVTDTTVSRTLLLSEEHHKSNLNFFAYLFAECLDLALRQRLAIEKHLNCLVEVINLIKVHWRRCCHFLLENLSSKSYNYKLDAIPFLA